MPVCLWKCMPLSKEHTEMTNVKRKWKGQYLLHQITKDHYITETEQLLSSYSPRTRCDTSLK